MIMSLPYWSFREGKIHNVKDDCGQSNPTRGQIAWGEDTFKQTGRSQHGDGKLKAMP